MARKYKQGLVRKARHVLSFAIPTAIWALLLYSKARIALEHTTEHEEKGRWKQLKWYQHYAFFFCFVGAFAFEGWIIFTPLAWMYSEKLFPWACGITTVSTLAYIIGIAGFLILEHRSSRPLVTV